MPNPKTFAKIVCVIPSKCALLDPPESDNSPLVGTTATTKVLPVAVLLLLLVTGAVRGQSTFVYTNDGVVPANTVHGFSVAPNGVLAPIAGSPFSTGGAGNGVGFAAADKVTISTVARFLYAGNAGSGNIGAFSINPVTGFLTPVPGSPFAAGANPGDISLAVTPDSNFLYCGNDFSGTISAFSIASNGALMPVTGSPFGVGAAIDEINVSPDGKFLSAALPFSGPFGSIAMFSIASNGALTPLPGTPFDGAGSAAAAAAGVDINCASSLLFASGATVGPTVVNVFGIASNGALSAITGSPFMFEGQNSNVPFLSPNGRLLFVSNQFTDSNTGSITVLNVAPNGNLTEVPGSPFANPGGFEPLSMGTDSAGNLLFVANLNNTLSVFGVASNGVLTPAPGSPFATGSPPGLLSLAVFPGKSCGVTFDTCMKDSTTGDVFAFNSSTGAYKYTRCSDGFSISGTGTVRSVNGVLNLMDSKPDRRVNANFLSGQLTGNATISFSAVQGVWQTFTVHDTTSFGTGCSCSN